MKKFFALVSVSLLFLTLIFKFLYLPGTSELLILTFAFSFPIFFILDFIGEWKSGASKLLASVYFVGVLALSQGLFYKMMHWPGADQLLILSLVFMLPIYFLFSAVMRNKKDGLARFSFLLFIFLCWTSLFVIMHYPGTVLFLAITLFIAMLVVIYELVKKEGQPIFQLVKHRHLVNASGLIAFLMFFQANRLPIRILDNEVTHQFSLEAQIAQEIEIGNRYITPSNKAFSLQIDKETMELLANIDAVKLALIDEVNDGIGTERNADRLAVLWKQPPKDGPLGIIRLNLAALDNKKDFDITMHRMIGSDLSQLSKASAGLHIWTAWIQHQEKLQKYIALNPNLDSTQRAQMLSTLQQIQLNWKQKEYQSYHELRHIHWVARTFDHATIVQAIVHLTELQYEVVRLRTMVVG
jgi:hypothetical protein